MLKRVFLALLLVAARSDDFENAEEEDELTDFDADNFDEDGYGGGDGGYGGYGGGYGDDEYGGGGDPTPAYEPIESFEGIQEFLAQDETEPGIVGFFDEERDADAKAVFESVAEGSRYDFRFGMVTDEAARTEAKLQKGPAVLVYPPPRFVSDKYEKKRARFPGKALEAEALKKFMYKKSVPLVGQKTWKSGERYDKQGVPVVTLFAAIDLDKNAKGYEYFANRVRKVAADFVGKLSFNIGDKEDFSYQLEDYDLSLDGKKDVGVGAKDGSKYYKMDSKFNVDNLRAFAEGVLAGTLTPKIKEEPSYDDYDADEPADDGPADYEGSDVAQLTADNYAELTDGKDAMLEFYAPWCGHCQHYAKQHFRGFGARLATAGTEIRAGVVSCTAEKKACSDFGVSGYPTVKAFGVLGNDERLGARSKADLLKLVEKRKPGFLDKGAGASTETAPKHPPPLKVARRRKAPAAQDAAASLRYALETAVATERGPVAGERLQALKGVLAAASAALPELAVAPAALRCLGDAVTADEWDSWFADRSGVFCPALGAEGVQTPAVRWSAACDPAGAGPEAAGVYTCGLWSLFHSIAAAPERALAPADGRAAIRAFVANFFGCATCRDHFLELYDSCAYGRCDEGVDSKLWLWRAHNAVNARVHGGLADAEVSERTPEDSAAPWAWPGPDQCAGCRRSGRWEPGRVAAFLERAYGSSPAKRLRAGARTTPRPSLDPAAEAPRVSGFFAVALCLGCALMLLWAMCVEGSRRRRKARRRLPRYRVG